MLNLLDIFKVNIFNSEGNISKIIVFLGDKKIEETENIFSNIEKEYIEKYHAQVPNGYNILPGGQLGGGFLGKNHSDNSIVKI